MKLYGYFNDVKTDSFIIILEYAPNGELYSELKKKVHLYLNSIYFKIFYNFFAFWKKEKFWRKIECNLCKISMWSDLLFT